MIKIIQFVPSRIVTIDWEKNDFIEASLTKRKKDQTQGTITITYPGVKEGVIYKDAQLRPFFNQRFYELHANITPESDPVETFMGVLPLSKLCIFSDTKDRNTKQSTFRDAEIRNLYDLGTYEVFSSGEIKCILPIENTILIYDYEKGKEK